MADRRGKRIDLVAWLLLAAGLALTACVVGQEEPPATFPPAEPVNLLGPLGASLARELYQLLGLAVYILLAAWYVLVLLLFLRKRWPTWAARLSGWLLLIPAAAVLADQYFPGPAPGSAAGGGGILGAWLAALLEDHVTPFGGVLALTAALLVGLFLALDVLVRGVMRLTWRMGRNGAAGSARGIGSWWSARREAAKFDAIPIVKHQKIRTDAGDIPIHHLDEDDPAPAVAPAASPPHPMPPEPYLLPINRPAALTQDAERFDDFELPSATLLEDPQPFPYEEHDQKLRETAGLLEKTFRDFDLNVHVVGINTGPVITQYELALETGLRVNKVMNLSDDLALNLKVPAVRIVAPIPGKNTVGIEIPNEHRAVVRLKEVILAAGKKGAKARIPLFLGKDTEGRPLVYDLADMPHLLIAGRTGTGKSVCMNAIILSMLMTRRPDEVRMVMIDPKMLELSEYGRIPHLMHPVVKDVTKAEAILAWAVDKMEERYDLLSRARVRNVAAYNDLDYEEIVDRVRPEADELDRIPQKMPYIVLFVDEMNDLMMQLKREVEGHIIRLAQKSRAAGIHLVVATQKPTVDVITGLIKSNLPARICFQVASRSDSRVVLDEIGADKLLGKGDLLFLVPGTSTLVRAQGTYASDEEITRVVRHLECDPCYAQELIQLKSSSEVTGQSLLDRLRSRDDMYEPAVEIVIREGRGSVSLLQRSLGIGYGRAARLIDFMAEDGIVGAYNGSSAREVLVTPEDWQQMRQSGQRPVNA